MLHQIPDIAEPAWLTNLTVEKMLDDVFPLQSILRNSLYYPSSGFDGDPVKYLGGNLLSFVYVDYGFTREEFTNAIAKSGFVGYSKIATRFVKKQELIPIGWQPTLPIDNDEDPGRFQYFAKEPFCAWLLFQRAESVPVSHGPKRFSFLYLCADGVAAYQALFLANSTHPKAVAIIQPGIAFGHNWTDFENPKRIFARTVLENPSGTPDLLLYGGRGKRMRFRQSCWPDYDDLVCYLEKHDRGSVGVWRRSRTSVQPPSESPVSREMPLCRSD